MSVIFPHSVLGPGIYERRQLKILFEQLYREWSEIRAEREEQFIPENIRFRHDPDWKNRFFSMTCINEGRHWFWRATKMVLGLGMVA